MFNGRFGLFNNLLERLGIGGLNWLSTDFALRRWR
jgi:ABC-type sugar transport system permease subunit